MKNAWNTLKQQNQGAYQTFPNFRLEYQGIYKIDNTIHNFSYIGQSGEFVKRFISHNQDILLSE